MYIYQVERDQLGKSIKKFSSHLHGKILDAGSGSKRYAHFFKGSEYLTIDINPAVKPDIVGNIESVPREDNFFNGIICTQVLGDVIDPIKALREFYRILKPGGIILITEGFMNELHGEPQDFWRFTPYGLQRLLESAGFSIEKIEKIGGIFSVSAQMFTRFAINSFNLYSHYFLGKIFSPIFFAFGKLAIGLDCLFRIRANEKIGLAIIAVAKKSKTL